jgi:ubiquinone/menaquinone biosynthesis C-methylase UbiE
VKKNQPKEYKEQDAMSHTTESQKEYASTYFVEDRSNQEEMERLEVQDKMLTEAMGGVLPELADPTSFRRVLDVGCGTGGWIFETARTYPMIEKLVGADISNKMMAYAREKAQAEALDGRVEFQTMDALRFLEFPASSFDLVNQRLGLSWLRTWEWAKVLSEYKRACRPGGIIRITEADVATQSNSPAMTKISNIVLEVFYRSGRLFTKSGDGVISELARLMTQQGILDVQTQVHTMVFRAGTLAGEYFYQDALHSSRVLLPFIQKWTRVPSDFAEISQQALKDIQQPGFVVTTTYLTAWGKNPSKKERSPQVV